MANFFYKVKNSKNEIIEGAFHAESLSAAAAILEQKGYVVLEVKEESGNIPVDFLSLDFSGKMTLTIQEKKDFFNSFYSLYKSGHSILEIFNLMHGSTKSAKIKVLCGKILQGVSQGQSLKESMKNCSEALGKAYSMLIVAGEESGKLEEVLSDINKNVLMQEKIKNDIISKITYPIVMIFLAIFVALLFKTFIIQVFNASIMGAKVCLVTLAIKSILQIGAVYAVIGIAIFLMYKNKSLMAKIISKFTAFAPIGNLVKSYTYANFFSVLSLAYSAGISLAEALYLSSTVVNLPENTDRLRQATFRVQQGCELTTALSATSLFSEYAISQIAAGEKAGELDKMLQAVAHDYETKLRVALDVALKLLEPAMIIFVGIIVLFVVLSGYKAYYSYLFSF
ncbi:type II secretion system F family protein [bacterium]|nr:type II secretion system F family protein [bacterium]